MNTDQEDELLALHSILGSEEFFRNEAKAAGEIRVSVELPADFSVVLKEGETLRQYELSFLPPLHLTFDLPEDYPASSPPSFTLTCSWLTQVQLSALSAHLADLYLASRGTVVLFTWVMFLKEDALRFLAIHSPLELPSVEHCTPPPEPNQDRHPTESVRVMAEQTLHTPEFGADAQDDLPTAAGEAEPPPSAQPDKSQEDNQNEKGAPCSFLLPSSTSDSLDDINRGAESTPGHQREPALNEDHTLSSPSPSPSPSRALLTQLLLYDATQQQKQFVSTVFDCGVCYTGWLGADCVQLPGCGHVFCRACLAQFCKLQITEGNVRGVTCPQANCTASPTPAQVRSLVGEELFSRYDRLLLQNTLDSMPDVVYCPRFSCGSAVIQEASGSAAVCSVCSFAFCVVCRKTYHGKEDCQKKKYTKSSKDSQQDRADLPQSTEGIQALWEDYANGSKERRRLLEARYGRELMRNSIEDCLSETWKEVNSKYCPHCFCRIEKNRGCNIMTCFRCGGIFCWVCLARLSDHRNAHFRDGSCTLWENGPYSDS